MPSYDSNGFDPPAPVAHVSVRNPSSGEAKSGVPMLLDTGADVTLLPLSVARELGIAGISEKTYELISFEGSRCSAIAAHAELIFLDRRFRGQFLLIDQELGIIGRNILNSVSLLFDGPRLNWDRASHP
jgi:aspartyl protease